MRIIFAWAGGIGNCLEAVPLYLRLKETCDEVTPFYLKQYGPESAKNAACCPANVIPEVNSKQLEPVADGYDYIIKTMPNRIFTAQGEFIDKFELLISEMDSEFEQNMKILDYLGIERGPVLREWREKPCEIPEGDYICMHNGGLNHAAWAAKKYPQMDRLAWKIQKELGIQVISIGAIGEHVPYTADYTGRALRESAFIIQNSTLHVSTDTGSYHLAALMEKPGVAIFTMTSQGKNYDKRFHGSIKTVQRDDLECCPCQWMYCWGPAREKCQRARCQEIPVDTVFEAVKAKLDG